MGILGREYEVGGRFGIYRDPFFGFPQGKAGGAGSVKHHQLQELIPVKTSESKPFSIPKPAPFNIRNPQDHRIQNGFVNNKKNKPHNNSKLPINR